MSRTYATGRSSEGTHRLQLQSELYAAHSRHLLRIAGVGEGMHLVDRGAAFEAMIRLLRPGGLLTFQDFSVTRLYSMPPVPLFGQGRHWICEALGRAGADPEAGGHLPAVLRAAGLTPAGAAASTAVGVDPRPATDLTAVTLASVLPVVLKEGIVTADEVDIDTYEHRLREQAAQAGATLFLPELVGAWARRDV